MKRFLLGKICLILIICAVFGAGLLFNCHKVSIAASNSETNEPKPGSDNSEAIKTESETAAQPDISFINPEHDFGEIFRGNKVVHVYKFENKGKSELKIDKVRSSCGCTAAVISSKNIEPGKFGELKVTFNTQSYNGKVSKNVTVYSNDPDTPKHVLKLTGVVIEEVAVQPKRVNISKVVKGLGSTINLSVKSLTDLKLKIKKIESTNKNVEVNFKKNKDNKTKDEYIVTVALKKDTDYGRVNGNLFIFTNSKNQEKITVPFYGEVIGDFAVYPPKISYGIVDKGREIAYPVFVTAYNKDVKIERLEVTPEFVEAEMTESKNRKKTSKILVSLKKNAPEGKIKGELRIFTNSKKQSQINVPVIGMVKKVDKASSKKVKKAAEK